MSVVGAGDRGERLRMHARVVIGNPTADSGVVKCGHVFELGSAT